MSSNSEARKRRSEILMSPDELAGAERDVTAERTRDDERRREVAQASLESIMSGASFDDADAFLLALEDHGARLVIDQ